MFSSAESILKKVKSIRREAFFIGVGQFLALLGGITGIKLLTQSLKPEEYGFLALGNSIAGFLVLFVFGPLSGVVARFFPVFREKKTLPTFFHVVSRILGKATFVILVSSIPLGAIFFSLWSHQWGILLLLSMVYGISVGLLASFQNIHNAMRFRGIVALHQAMDAWIRPLMAFFLISLWGPWGLLGVLGFMLGSLLVNLSQVVFLSRNQEIRQNFVPDVSPEHERKKIRGEFWEYFYPFVFFSISGWIISFADRWFLQFFYGSHEVGVYSAVAQIASIPILLIGSISQFIMPILFERAGMVDSQERMEQTNRLLRLVVAGSAMIMFSLFLLAVMFGESIMLLCTSKEYAGESTLLWGLVLAQSFGQIANLLSFKGLYFNQASRYIVPRLLQAVLFVSLTFVLLPRWRIYGIVTSLVVSSVFLVILVGIKNRKMVLVKPVVTEMPLP